MPVPSCFDLEFTAQDGFITSEPWRRRIYYAVASAEAEGTGVEPASPFRGDGLASRCLTIRRTPPCTVDYITELGAWNLELRTR